MRSFFENLFAEIEAPRFKKLLEGTEITLASGQTFNAKVTDIQRKEFPIGYRLPKHTFQVIVSNDNHKGYGVGEAETELLAFQKAISEGFERLCFYETKGTSYGTLNSNGWASHLSIDGARQAGLDELLERDAVLVHWLGKIPFNEISHETLPRWVQDWSRDELSQASPFNRLRVLVTNQGHAPVIVTMFMADDGRAAISHAIHSNPEVTLRKALTETRRIALIASTDHWMVSAQKLLHSFKGMEFKPEDHATVYARHLAVPSWVFGSSTSWTEVKKSWSRKYRQSRRVSYEFVPVTMEPLVSGYCRSHDVQGLYFGTVEEARARGLLNFRRLGWVVDLESLNPLPHFVP